MALKFLAGIIYKENNEKVTTAFWESMTCNIDGVIDLGIDKKVELYMNLLGQIPKNNKKSIEIPNKKVIEEFINDEVLSDINKWKDVIKSSNYLSS